MSAEQLVAFDEMYKSNLIRKVPTSREATEQDRRIAQDFKAGKGIKELSKFYGMSQWSVLNAIALASR